MVELTQERKQKTGIERQIIIFKLSDEEFGVDINEVREIIRVEQITKIPNTASYIKGVINLRGGIIVVLDLAMKLNLPAKKSDKNSRIIIIEINNNTVGMIVDYATEVIRIDTSQIEPAPAIIKQKIDAEYIEGVGVLGERLLILLDLAKLLEAKEIEQIEQVQQNTNPDKVIDQKKSSEKPKGNASEEKTEQESDEKKPETEKVPDKANPKKEKAQDQK